MASKRRVRRLQEKAEQTARERQAHLKRKQCGTKTKYLSAYEAELTRKYQEQTGGVHGLQVYQCDFCHHWHLGHA